MKKLLTIILAVLVLFVCVLMFNTVTFTSKQENTVAGDLPAVDSKTVLTRLSKALRIPTISHQDSTKFDTSKIGEFHRFLAESYPMVHQELEREVINDYSLLYKWPGSDPSLKAVALLAHIDVVPIEPGTESQWKYNPFSGAIAEGYVWGRGAIDMKSTLTAIMEAAEEHLKQGYVPRRTLYFAFGHDEELGGLNGAKRIAEHLKSKGVRIDFTVDEGMPILNEQLSPIQRQTAIIAVAEKGYITLKITAKEKGGHSSMPPLKTTLGVLARAITALEDNQMTASYDGPAKLLFDYIGPEMPFLKKMLFANSWFFESVIISQLEKITAINASLRTTTAPTIIKGGIKENVLPSQAYALVNFRIRPGDTPDDVIAHAIEVIDNPAVEVAVHGRKGTFPSPIAAVDAVGFKLIQKTIGETFKDTVVAPGLMVAGTDTKHYITISDNNYRHYPIVFGPNDPKLIHGTNERIAVASYLKMIQYSTRLIVNLSR